MELSRDLFGALTFLESRRGRALPASGEIASGETIAAALGISLEKAGSLLSRLAAEGLADIAAGITDKGLEALEPYRVRRAVFFAAGFGSRMLPITLNTPKPLVRVKGVRIIDTLLDAVIAAGIEEILIVRGYQWEQFDQLLYKYPVISFFKNPLYNETNNISSALCVRDYFSNAYVFESDLLLRNPDLITKYQYASNYLGVPVTATDDWCLETKNGRVSKIAQGGRNCYHMFGISYWTKEAGEKLADHLKLAYHMPGGKSRLWDYTPLEFFRGDYQVEVRECAFDDITEIDSFAELQELDEAYRV
jgi:CTP:phosphocholine cytidylyltransferase-like protein